MSRVRPSTQILATGTPSATTYLRGDDTWAAIAGTNVVDWVSVKAHGAVGDWTTDDTAAVQAAHDALPASGGVIYLPAGQYRVTASINISKPCTIIGDGVSNMMDTTALSVLGTSSATVTVLNVSTGGCMFASFTLRCTATTPTSGAGISVTNGDGNRYVDLTVANFYNGLDLVSGAVWHMRDCAIRDFRNYGIKIQNTINADAGDSVIYGGVIAPKSTTAQAGIRYESSGGLKVLGTKFVCTAGTDDFAYGIDAAFSVSTGDLLVTGCSLENMRTAAIHVATVSTGTFGNIVIVGNQIDAYSATGAAITLSAAFAGNISDVVITGNVLRHSQSASTSAAVTMTGVNRAQVGPNVVDGYAAHLSQTSCTNVAEWTTPGTFTVQDEGTPLTQRNIIDFVGTGVTATDDAGNGRTLVTIPGAPASREVLMSSDGTATPLLSSDGKDWLYGAP